MSIFLDSLWIWIGITIVVAAVGYFIYQNDPRGRTLGIVVGVTILVFILGLVLYYGVDTDQKSISRMLNHLASELEQDDLDGVLSFISPKAGETRGIARLYMGNYHLTSAKFRNLKFEVNQLTSPPQAKVSFLAVVYWKTKHPTSDGFVVDTPQFQTVRFDIELEKTMNRSWFVTNKCDFDYRLQP
ncbi:MAG: hypothetical protein LBC20_10185 [Planctomycetaceae bacterium]|jgi:hypothetical protein|nr:hypothetical protein [Planctomycetaceae bacterium]